MQIAGLSQWVSRQKMAKIGIKRVILNVTSLIPMDYKRRSFLAYLRPTLMLVIYTRVMRGTL